MKKLSFIPFLLLLLSLSCTNDFEKINTNPNSPDEVTNVGLLLPNAIRSAVNNNFSSSYDRGSIAANLIASDYASNFSNWARADASGYFLWNNYDYIRDLNEVIMLSEEKGLKNYKGIAMVLRSWLFQNLTDIYGPIPFRDAASAKLTGISNPTYESQKAVYAGLLADLEEANTLLSTGTESVTGDILYNGSTSSWRKFGNSLRLRLLMRQSKRVDPTAEMKKMVGDVTTYPVFTSNADQAALEYIADIPANESPFYRSGNGGTSTKISKQLVDYLIEMNDKRLYVYALPTPASSAIDASGNRPDPSKFVYAGDLNGIGSLPNANITSPTGMLWMSIQYSPDLANAKAGEGILMSYSELQFILAEAAEKGYITGGSTAAEKYYQNGIKDQFTYLASRIPANYATSYLKLTPAGITADDAYFKQDAVAYTGTSAQKLEKIGIQKWISLYLVGYEAWSEWRRTGIPTIPVGPVGPGYIPRRMFYPADELRINEANYAKGVALLGGADDLKTRVWWDKQ
ncbi:SusD/RagB family nutrient-binding outer membrane lipoprotein [Dyadobacter subterraneus]|uniref:SusD/RagB family nutrient-binding outer membrane lipoprotein n=1 Tax=Dyadobacter subterraneus TaxID=2773304 RepID=A0ABR9WA83_9BACT|nr:SusD/RagB family nutrient-binding outer membrane lipoprotein [Dyadobacter subterraneus]MBE9462386.1 SusD/RagB family nutrient-binding outer membrane lipoprotein [Dyadobacter subterraneus]